MTSYRVWEP